MFQKKPWTCVVILSLAAFNVAVLPKIDVHMHVKHMRALATLLQYRLIIHSAASSSYV